MDGVIHYSYIGDKPNDVFDEDEIILNEDTSLPNNGIKRKMKVTWDGAAQSARMPIEDKLFVCEACNDEQDAFLTTLLVENDMNAFSNQFRATRLVCIKCLQKCMHQVACHTTTCPLTGTSFRQASGPMQ